MFRIKPDDENLAALLEMHFARSREPLMFQRYEPAVRQGDKRIILVDGEPVGAVNRVPAEGEARSNMHVGGRPEKCTLTARDREICAAIGPTLREQGMIFVGIDVIGDWLTEINVTSPTGIQEIDRFDGVHLGTTNLRSCQIQGRRSLTLCTGREARYWRAVHRRLENQADPLADFQPRRDRNRRCSSSSSAPHLASRRRCSMALRRAASR